MSFIEFPKMPRLSRECVVTEKIDGTNAQVYIVQRNACPPDIAPVAIPGEFAVFAGSRNRWITPADDNFGFAAWVVANSEELATLGAGRHFGEWWGSGIQRGYGLSKGEKRFSLFNVTRWHAKGDTPRSFPKQDPRLPPSVTTEVPECCGVVPLLTRGNFDELEFGCVLERLERFGSLASPGFMSPEGIVVFHVAGQVGFKKTIGNDGAKGTR